MAFFKFLLSLIASALVEFFRDRRRDADLKAQGRAEAERDAAIQAAERAEDMAGVPLPDDNEVRRRLREGSA